jgi:hypothetical protein
MAWAQRTNIQPSQNSLPPVFVHAYHALSSELRRRSCDIMATEIEGNMFSRRRGMDNYLENLEGDCERLYGARKFLFRISR